MDTLTAPAPRTMESYRSESDRCQLAVPGTAGHDTNWSQAKHAGACTRRSQLGSDSCAQHVCGSRGTSGQHVRCGHPDSTRRQAVATTMREQFIRKMAATSVEVQCGVTSMWDGSGGSETHVSQSPRWPSRCGWWRNTSIAGLVDVPGWENPGIRARTHGQKAHVPPWQAGRSRAVATKLKVILRSARGSYYRWRRKKQN